MLSQNDLNPVDFGYNVSSQSGRKLVGRYGSTSVLRSIAQYFNFNFQLITFTILCGYCVSHESWILSIIGVGLVSLLGSRAFRGLENLVHEGSHWNLSRSMPKLNDFISDILCGSATMNLLSHYRSDHDQHHLYFGTPFDPDYVKFTKVGVARLPQCINEKKYLETFSIIASYWKSHFIRLTSPKIFVRYIAWNALAVLLPAFAVGNLLSVKWSSILLGSLILMIFSPVVRLIAESSEHDYLRVENTFQSTFTNLGWYEFFFPLNDCFHLLHHLIPTIPFWSLRDANYELASADKTVFGLQSRKRGPEKYFFKSAS